LAGPLRYPIHVYLARRLRQAERALLGQSKFSGKTPVELAAIFSIDEKHAGGRLKADSRSIHTFGIGTDIKYKGNPHIGDYRDKPNGAAAFTRVMKDAALKISKLTISDSKFPEFLHKIGTDTTKSTGQVFDAVFARDQDLRLYLAIHAPKMDVDILRNGVFKGRVTRDPLQGFMNLDRDLVIALRETACLIWGAVDLGKGSSGDIMHFDCRLDEVGRALFCGGTGLFQ
jgi:hypothetical protein